MNSAPLYTPDNPDWNADHVDAEVERTYRRGFAQGAAQVLYALLDGVSFDEIENWINNDVWDWRESLPRNETAAKPTMPPSRPHEK